MRGKYLVHHSLRRSATPSVGDKPQHKGNLERQSLRIVGFEEGGTLDISSGTNLQVGANYVGSVGVQGYPILRPKKLGRTFFNK